MSKIATVAADTALVAEGTRGRLYSVFFYSHTGDTRIRMRDGGSSGTVKFDSLIDATTAIGDDRFSWTCGDPKGAEFTDGIYADIDGTIVATVEYGRTVTG